MIVKSLQYLYENGQICKKVIAWIVFYNVLVKLYVFKKNK